MAEISSASKIAIMFIRPFRSYLDGHNLINKIRPEIEKNVDARIDDVISQLGITANDDNSIEKDKFVYKYNFGDLKDFFYKVTMRILDKYEKSYAEILPKFIDLVTIEIENELKLSYTSKELDELYNLLSNPLLQKLLGNNLLFGILKRTELQIDFELQMKFLENLGSYQTDTKIQDFLTDYQNKFKKQNPNYWSERNDSDYYDDDDENDEKTR